MELKGLLEKLNKEYESKLSYRQKLVEALEKTNQELLRIEGGISITSSLIKQEEEKLPTQKEKPLPKKPVHKE